MIDNGQLEGTVEDAEKRRVVIDTAIRYAAEGELIKDAVNLGYRLLEELEEAGTWA
jgi:hypothetical protein